jgi:DDE superfamily endonuclease
MWCVAELNRDYIKRMEDVLAVYEKPYQASEPVICLDEKPISLHADVRPARSAKPGKPARPDNEYKRCGTANVFGVVEPKAGRHFTIATPNRSAAQFAYVVRHVVGQLINVNYIDRNDNYIDRRSGVNNQHHPVSFF